MAIGTLGAIALGAGALGSAALGSSAANKASRAATDAANQSAAVQREQLAAAQNALGPYVNAGQPATQQINALLGIGDNTDWGAYVRADPAAFQDWQTHWAGGEGALGNKTIDEYGQFHYNLDGRRRDLTPFRRDGMTAFDQFRNSSGYDFRVKQGMNALNSGYAGAGTIKSGAAIKGAIDYGQGMASQEFGNYLNALGNQQGVGLSAGSALAGVGQNYANSMGNIYSNKADAIGNAALVNASNTSNMLNGLTAGIFKYGVK